MKIEPGKKKELIREALESHIKSNKRLLNDLERSNNQLSDSGITASQNELSKKIEQKKLDISLLDEILKEYS